MNYKNIPTMKKLIIAVSLLTTLSACHTAGSGTSVTPSTTTGTLNITFNGKTYNITNSSNTAIHSFDVYFIDDGWAYQTNFQMLTPVNGIQIGFQGIKRDRSTMPGNYADSSFQTTNPTAFITDSAINSYVGVAPGTTANITVYTAHEIKGTFTMTVVSGTNSQTYTATGNFDYNK